VWIDITVLAYSFLCFDFKRLFEDQGIFKCSIVQLAGFWLWTSALIAVLIFIFLIPIYWKHLKIQKINNQPSWVFYSSFGFLAVISFWSTYIISLFFNFPKLYENIFHLEYLKEIDKRIIETIIVGIWFIIFEIGKFCGGLVYRYKIKAVPTSKNLRFAEGSVGGRDDSYNGIFLSSAKHAGQGFLKFTDPVNVVALFGERGCGKSSYARMIVEELNSTNKMLYSYISLTETNETTDFSRLFSQRWCEALNIKYPKIDAVTGFALMQTMLRESKLGFCAEAFSLLAKFDVGLIKTKAKVWDIHLVKEPEFVSDSVAKSFGNIPEFKEDLWVFMIDEIERSPLDEIYRVIEIIERFKSEARTGLPLKIVFLLCISTDFKERLSALRGKGEILALIDGFLFKDSKSVTQRLFLPPLSRELKIDFVLKYLDDFVKRNEVKRGLLVIDKQLTGIDIRVKIERQYLSAEEAEEYAIRLLSEESPRFVKKCISETEFFYNSYRSKSELPKEDIRFADILLLSYARIKYPDLIDFFIKTIEKFTPEGGDTSKLYSYLELEVIRKNKFNLADYITEVVNKKIPDSVMVSIKEIIGVCARFYIDYINKSNKRRMNIFLYAHSASEPYNLKSYLSIISGKYNNPDSDLMGMYYSHKGNDNFLGEIKEYNKLIRYSGFLSDVEDAGFDLNLNIASELCKRLLQGDIPLTPRQSEDTARDLSVRAFLSHWGLVVKKGGLKTIREEIVSLLKQLLDSRSLDSGLKYNIVVYCCGLGGASSYLTKAFDEILKSDQEKIKASIQFVFEQVCNRYFDGTDVIYEKEEDFFRVLSYSWSGDLENKQEFDKIKACATRGLEKYPDAIKLYWDRYHYFQAWKGKSFDNILKYYINDPHDILFSRDLELFVPLKKLIEITDKIDIKALGLTEKVTFWKEKADNPEEFSVYSEKCKPQKVQNVLLWALREKGLFD
jgi:hypothetical protein